MRKPWNRGGETQEGPGEPVRESRAPEAPRAVHPEFDIVLLPDGTAIFSWNSANIQEMADHLGTPEFKTSRWCG